jgi:hypothetical protein
LKSPRLQVRECKQRGAAVFIDFMDYCNTHIKNVVHTWPTQVDGFVAQSHHQLAYYKALNFSRRCDMCQRDTSSHLDGAVSNSLFAGCYYYYGPRPASSKMGVERALKSHVSEHVSLFSLANLPARAQTRAISTHVPIFDEDRTDSIPPHPAACSSRTSTPTCTTASRQWAGPCATSDTRGTGATWGRPTSRCSTISRRGVNPRESRSRPSTTFSTRTWGGGPRMCTSRCVPPFLSIRSLHIGSDLGYCSLLAARLLCLTPDTHAPSSSFQPQPHRTVSDNTVREW